MAKNKKAPKKSKPAAVKAAASKPVAKARDERANATSSPVPPIGGWLMVLVIVLLLGVILNLSTLAFNVHVLRDPSQSELLLRYPKLHIVVLYEVIGLSLSILAAGYAVYLVFWRKRLAKLWITVLLLLMLLFTVQDMAWIYRIAGVSPTGLKGVDTGVIARAMFAAMLGIPYLWVSKRVARTLTEPWHLPRSHS